MTKNPGLCGNLFNYLSIRKILHVWDWSRSTRVRRIGFRSFCHLLEGLEDSLNSCKSQPNPEVCSKDIPISMFWVNFNIYFFVSTESKMLK